MQLEKLKLLEDIRQADEAIIRYTQGKSKEDYLSDDQLQASVERKFEIIGEALNRLRQFDSEMVEEIEDCRKIIAFRNTLIHGYSSIDNEIVWDIVNTHLPRLRQTIQKLLSKQLMTTDATKKKTSRLAIVTLFFCVITSAVNILVYVTDYVYWDSLRTNQIVGHFGWILWSSLFFLKGITYFTALVSIIRVTLSKGRLKGIQISVIAIIITALVASVMTPSTGLSLPFRYKKIANEFVSQTSSQLNSKYKNISLNKYDIEATKYLIPEGEPRIIEVTYTLKEQFDSPSYPQKFKVLLNFDTGGKSIKEDKSTEE